MMMDYATIKINHLGAKNEAKICPQGLIQESTT